MNNFEIEVANLEEFTAKGIKPPKARFYRVRIDGEYYKFDKPIVNGEEVLLKANKTPIECYSLYQKYRGCDFEKISLDEEVDLRKPGIERFVVKAPEVWHYLVDSEPETTDKNKLTANQILELTNLIPSEYYLVLVNSDGSQTSYKDNPDELIEMKCPRLKFISVYKSSTPVAWR